ncbi:hypothetical protein [Propioniciclava sinopodophylli]|uniref:hypothetical protein n=1 Tax=Propioniciclava sinopodophylli TaxID=1837344 RepID=UPI002490E443|nr:hypothetical protein [Propioniciclava sinopodophylli]
MGNSPDRKRIIEVFIDESMRAEPKLVLAGAIVFEDAREELDARIRELYEDISGSFYLDDARSFRKFRKAGFHATDDNAEISSQFVRLIARISGAKLFIESSDQTSRPDLSVEQTIALLEVRLVETILRKFAWAEEVRFTFERHSKLDDHYPQIVHAGKRRAHYRGEVHVVSAAKMEPPSLAIVDYALYHFARAHNPGAAEWERLRWRAFRPLVSSVRSLDAGGVPLRRGLHAEVP